MIQVSFIFIRSSTARVAAAAEHHDRRTHDVRRTSQYIQVYTNMSQVVRFPDVVTVTELGPCWLGASGSESASWAASRSRDAAIMIV
jgi:hypothetical protein